MNNDQEMFSQLMEEIKQQITIGTSDEIIIQWLVSGENIPETMAMKIVGDLRQKTYEENPELINTSEQSDSQEEGTTEYSKISEREREIRDKVLGWRNNAFSNSEIVQKLTEKYDLSEEEAKETVKAIHVVKSGEERQEAKKAEQKAENNYNLYLGAFLLTGGIIAAIVLSMLGDDDELEDFIRYAIIAAIGGFFQMLAGLRKKSYKG